MAEFSYKAYFRNRNIPTSNMAAKLFMALDCFCWQLAGEYPTRSAKIENPG